MDRKETDADSPDRSALELWAGEAEDSSGPRPSMARRWLLAALLLVAGAAGVVLAKYAVDVLTILLALVAAGLLLHVVGRYVVQSDLLSFGWLAIAALGVCLVAVVLFVPAGGVGLLSRHVPQPVVDFIDWSERHGWAQRALVVPGEQAAAPAAEPASEGTAGQAAPSPATVPPRLDAAPAGEAIAVSESSAVSNPGEAVVLTARLGKGTEGAAIRFYDGNTLLGEGSASRVGAAMVATLTVTTLQRGPHDITAEAPGGTGVAGRRSPPVHHVVR